MKTQNQFRFLKSVESLKVFLCMAVVIFAISSCSEKKGPETIDSLETKTPPKPPTMTGSDTTWVEPDEMPVFPNGDAALLNYIAENVKYPEIAKKDGTQGKVIIRFCVTSRGNVSNCEVLKKVSPEIDAEALRVVSSLPQFEPGKVDGKPVSVWYMVPITFALK